MSEPTREHEISLSPVSRRGVSLKNASLLPGRVQSSSFQGPKPYKARVWLYLLKYIKIDPTTESA